VNYIIPRMMDRSKTRDREGRSRVRGGEGEVKGEKWGRRENMIQRSGKQETDDEPKSPSPNPKIKEGATRCKGLKVERLGKDRDRHS